MKTEPDSKIQTLWDHEQIRQLAARYNHALDNAILADYLECYTDDGMFSRENSDMKAQGRAELTRIFTEFPNKGRRHLCTDHVIDVDGDTAKAQLHLLYLDLNDGASICMVGVYRDDLFRTPTGWKFRLRSLRIL